MLKNIKMPNLWVKNWNLRVWYSLFHFFHAICKISNFYTWTARHLAQASFTKLTLPYNTIYLALYNSILFIPDYSRWTRGGQQDPQTSCQANARLQDQIPSAFSCTEVQGITFQGQQTKHILSVNFCFLLASKITKIKTPLWW